MEPGLWHAVIAVHPTGAVHVALPVWRQMRQQAYGRIVNASSASGLFGNFGLAVTLEEADITLVSCGP